MLQKLVTVLQDLSLTGQVVFVQLLIVQLVIPMEFVLNVLQDTLLVAILVLMHALLPTVATAPAQLNAILAIILLDSLLPLLEPLASYVLLLIVKVAKLLTFVLSVILT